MLNISELKYLLFLVIFIVYLLFENGLTTEQIFVYGTMGMIIMYVSTKIVDILSEEKNIKTVKKVKFK